MMNYIVKITVYDWDIDELIEKVVAENLTEEEAADLVALLFENLDENLGEKAEMLSL